ncbi:response regulator [Chlorobaculum sp. 24CR]|uniref:GAF domain-containing protein n=1 Tax=Chlorobaculum sp. 24CR TaxID=2508878 RepID=UPI00100A824C|nr:GAF domain-containing protein [Chlorobaculum sp. 24CR]RXK84771.1 response regulator [Chlorobaculum sp. 24CR]
MTDEQIDTIDKQRAPSPGADGETSFLMVFRNHAAVMLLVDTESGGIVDANPAAAEFYGWPVERFLSMNMRDIDAPSWTRDEAWLKELATREHGRFVSMHRRADGSLRFVEVCHGVTRLHGITALLCIVQDNSERQYFEALTAFRLRLLEMVESASTEELLTFTLDEAEHLTGSTLGFFNFVSNDQTIFRHACSSNAKTDNCGHAEHPSVIDFGVSTDVISEKQAVIHNDHATLRHCNCKFSPHHKALRELIVPIIRNGKVMATLEIGNKPVGYDAEDIRLVSMLTGLAWDIIAKKYAEESEQKMQEAMQHTQKMELIGRLAGGIAHDINNVLTAILGHAEIVIDNMGGSSPYAENLLNIRDSTMRAANLIHQLLAFARKQTIQPEVLLLDAALDTEMPMLQELAGEEVQLRWRPGAPDARLFLDPSQLDQIMTNLCANSRDAMNGHGSVTVETSVVSVEPSDCFAGHPCQTPGDFAAISVTDTGYGIDENVLPHIFEPFFTTKEVGKGTGMGLSTVYGIVKQNKGFLDCQSVPGKGACFTLYLPLFKADASESGAKLPDATDNHDRRKTILLVDDNQAIVQVIKSLLEKNGYVVLPAITPEEAIRIGTEPGRSVDLLLTDVVMPEMDGKELSAKLLAICPDLKTLFMSGYNIDMTDLDCAHGNGTHFIRKPFRINELTSMISTILA